MIELPKTLCPTTEEEEHILDDIPDLCPCPIEEPKIFSSVVIDTITKDFDCRTNALVNMAKRKRCDGFNLVDNDSCHEQRRLNL